MPEYLVTMRDGRTLRLHATSESAARERVRQVSGGIPMRTRIAPEQRPKSDVRIVHNKVLGGWYIVRGPHHTPLNGRFDSREEAQAWLNRNRNG